MSRQMTKAQVRASRRATKKADLAFASWHRKRKDREAVTPLLVVAGALGGLWILSGGWSA